MTDEKTTDAAFEAVEDTALAYKSLEAVEQTLDTFLSAASVDKVYGEPIEKGDTLILPAAEIVAGMGFGLGSGAGGDPKSGGSGSGGGGGGRVFSRPVAVIIASPDGVRVEPVVDVTKIALAAFTAGAFMLGMMARLSSPAKAMKDLQKGEWD